MSPLLYGTETWCIKGKNTKQYLHSSITRLYKRILHLSPTDHCSDEEILHRTGLPDPAVLLRLRRLGYVGSLLQVGDFAMWGLLNRDRIWLELLRDDFQWVYHHIKSTCTLGNPKEHTARWLEIIVFHRGYCRRLLKRAKQLSSLVHSRQHVCRTAHQQTKTALQQANWWQQPSGQALTCAREISLTCTCSLTCTSRPINFTHLHMETHKSHPLAHGDI